MIATLMPAPLLPAAWTLSAWIHGKGEKPVENPDVETPRRRFLGEVVLFLAEEVVLGEAVLELAVSVALLMVVLPLFAG